MTTSIDGTLGITASAITSTGNISGVSLVISQQAPNTISGLTVSSPQVTPLPTTSQVLSYSHSLGVAPVDATLELVCLTAELGYTVGDTVTNVFNQPSGTSYTVSSVRKTAALVSAVTGASVAFCISHASTGVPSTPTAANWAYRFKLRTN